MRRFKEKLNKKGFTLAELLIVVAIIAVLVAVSVPVFNSKLEKAREATDVANMRAAKAAVVADYVNEDIALTDSPVFYDADRGIIVKDIKDIKNAYGQGTTVNGKTSYTDYKTDEDNKGKVIQITIKDESKKDDDDKTDGTNISYSLEWVLLKTS